MKVYQHIVFWVVVTVVLTFVFASWFGGRVEAFYYVSLLLPVVMATSYFFNYYLVPRFLFKRRFRQFTIYSLYMLVVSLCLELLASITAMLLIVYMKVNAAGPLVTDLYTLAVILYFIVLFKSFILLIKYYFVDQKTIGELEEERIRQSRGHITIRSNRKSSRISYDELLYIESLADYIKIHRESGPEVLSKMKISHIEKELPETFIRIHRSFIVNRSKITSFSMEYIQLGAVELPISRTYKREVIDLLQAGSKDRGN
jgi:two-component system response regulator LytT